ncbi:MAG TPA: hypothetical protein VKR32_12060 [Puia sp.]|nr:hypothetical protein [Puia sp.]
MTSYQIAESASFIISLVCYDKLRHTPYKWFPWFLGITVLVEFYGPYYTRRYHASNVWLYNIFTPLEIIFYAWIFHSIYRGRIVRKLSLGFIPAYIIAVTINEAFIQGFGTFHSYTMLVGDFFVVLFSCCYFYELLKSNTQQSFLSITAFWIVTGLFFFYLGNIFYDLYWDYLLQNNLDNRRKIFNLINNNLILLLYACFSIGFICSKKAPLASVS